MSNVLMLLGMHRSGTSMVSAWLNACKLNMGARLGGPGITNKFGHFEDLDFLQLHRNLLSQKNIDDRGLALPLDFKLTIQEMDEIERLVQTKNLSSQWGWKEPRTCLFLKYYSQLIPNSKYVILYRDYLFVIESLIRRDKSNLIKRFQQLSRTERIQQLPNFENELEKIFALKDQYLLAWITYNKKLLSAIAGKNQQDILILRYVDFIKHDQLIFEKLLLWNFDLHYYSFERLFDQTIINEDLPTIDFNNEYEQEAISILQMMNKLSQSFDESN